MGSSSLTSQSDAIISVPSCPWHPLPSSQHSSGYGISREPRYRKPVSGTGSYPPAQYGLQRNIRHTVNISPTKKPRFSNASIAYAEQEGVKRQQGLPFKGDKIFL